MIRLATFADAQVIKDHWDAYRAGLAEYAREQGWTVDRVREWLTDSNYFLAVDPDTQTVGLFIAHPPDVAELSFMGTLTAGVLAKRRAADQMSMWFLDRAIERRAVRVYGEYMIPTGVDDTTTGAVRYFGNLPGVTITRRQADGGVIVRIEMFDLPGSRAAIEARQ